MESIALTVIIAILVIYIYYTKNKEPKTEIAVPVQRSYPQTLIMSEVNWRANSSAKFSEFIEKFGTVSALCPESDGFACWRKNKLLNTCFTEILIRDEAIKIMDRSCCLYITYGIEIPEDFEISLIPFILCYDSYKKQVTVRTESIADSLAIVRLLSSEIDVSMIEEKLNESLEHAKIKELENYNYVTGLIKSKD